MSFCFAVWETSNGYLRHQNWNVNKFRSRSCPWIKKVHTIQLNLKIYLRDSSLTKNKQFCVWILLIFVNVKIITLPLWWTIVLSIVSYIDYLWFVLITVPCVAYCLFLLYHFTLYACPQCTYCDIKDTWLLYFPLMKCIPHKYYDKWEDK